MLPRVAVNVSGNRGQNTSQGPNRPNNTGSQYGAPSRPSSRRPLSNAPRRQGAGNWPTQQQQTQVQNPNQGYLPYVGYRGPSVLSRQQNPPSGNQGYTRTPSINGQGLGRGNTRSPGNLSTNSPEIQHNSNDPNNISINRVRGRTGVASPTRMAINVDYLKFDSSYADENNLSVERPPARVSIPSQLKQHKPKDSKEDQGAFTDPAVNTAFDQIAHERRTVARVFGRTYVARPTGDARYLPPVHHETDQQHQGEQRQQEGPQPEAQESQQAAHQHADDGPQWSISALFSNRKELRRNASSQDTLRIMLNQIASPKNPPLPTLHETLAEHQGGDKTAQPPTAKKLTNKELLEKIADLMKGLEANVLSKPHTEMIPKNKGELGEAEAQKLPGGEGQETKEPPVTDIIPQMRTLLQKLQGAMSGIHGTKPEAKEEQPDEREGVDTDTQHDNERIGTHPAGLTKSHLTGPSAQTEMPLDKRRSDPEQVGSGRASVTDLRARDRPAGSWTRKQLVERWKLEALLPGSRSPDVIGQVEHPPARTPTPAWRDEMFDHVRSANYHALTTYVDSDEDVPKVRSHLRKQLEELSKDYVSAALQFAKNEEDYKEAWTRTQDLISALKQKKLRQYGRTEEGRSIYEFQVNEHVGFLVDAPPRGKLDESKWEHSLMRMETRSVVKDEHLPGLLSEQEMDRVRNWGDAMRNLHYFYYDNPPQA